MGPYLKKGVGVKRRFLFFFKQAMLRRNFYVGGYDLREDKWFRRETGELLGAKSWQEWMESGAIMGELALDKNRASSPLITAGTAENRSRDHAGGLADLVVGRGSASHLSAFLCIYYISEVWGRVIWRDSVGGLKREEKEEV